jgi:hypothetical protein
MFLLDCVFSSIFNPFIFNRISGREFINPGLLIIKDPQDENRLYSKDAGFANRKL